MRTHTKTFHIRFTEKEYDRLCKYADKAGLPKTTYIRHMINGCRPKERPGIDYFNFMNGFYHLGNNLNQIVHLAHKFGSLHAVKLVCSPDCSTARIAWRKCTSAPVIASLRIRITTSVPDTRTLWGSALHTLSGRKY